MAYLIIVCPHSGKQPLWRGQGARSPACWHQPGTRASFFVEMARLRASFRPRKHRDTDRSKPQGRLGQACTVYGCPTSHTVQVFLSERDPASAGGRTLSSSLLPKDIPELLVLLTSSDQTLCHGGVGHASYSVRMLDDVDASPASRIPPSTGPTGPRPAPQCGCRGHAVKRQCRCRAETIISRGTRGLH